MMFSEPCKQKRTQLPPPSRCGALYVHVPFCAAKCAYCDFYSVPHSGDAVKAFLRAAAAELDGHAARLDRPLRTIYVGGGTPTVLDAPLLAGLLARLRPLAGPDTEFSVEANPGTLDEPTLSTLRQAGVNRLTVGVQSLRDAELRLLGRIHTAAEARRAVAAARGAGFDNLGVDLVYGIPGQSVDSWTATLEEALSWAPEHVSCYALSFEPGTPLAAARDAGEVREMPEAAQEACYRAAIDACARAGLAHYEISNFAAPGRHCRHNLTYWHNEPYLGIGPGAASFLDGIRRTNRPDLAGYVEALSAGRPAPADAEHLTGRAALAETVMLALRLVDGLNRAEFVERFGLDVLEAFPESLARHRALGTVVVSPGAVRLAGRALFVSDSVLADILAEA